VNELKIESVYQQHSNEDLTCLIILSVEYSCLQLCALTLGV